MTAKLTFTLKNRLSLDDLFAYAIGACEAVTLDDDPGFRTWIDGNHEFLQKKLAEGWPVYGASTGFGASSASRLGPDETAELQRNLFRYHGCGVGPSFCEAELAAILLVRLNCLTQGCSAVSFDLLNRLQVLLQERALPLIPMRGSVGASGDLTPLSYIAAALAGERQVLWRNQVVDAAEFWEKVGRAPYAFKAREALAIMNGTSVMSAIAGLACLRLERIGDLAAFASACMVEIWQGPCAPFLDELHAVKPHAGQRTAAEKIRRFLHEPATRLLKRQAQSQEPSYQGAVQDPYSIRCAPQILGAFHDALSSARNWIETEINSVNDNPVFLHEENLVLNGGHFLGQHITLACDMLKASCANLVNLMDRQMALLLEPGGRLPDNLLSRKVPAPLHHGFKAMQITMSSLAAEIAKAATPMSVFSRPTEASNQDVVSMGTIAARDLMQMSDMAMDALTIHLMALRQAFYLLEEAGSLPPLHSEMQTMLRTIGKTFAMQREDQALDRNIQDLKSQLFGGLSWR